MADLRVVLLGGLLFWGIMPGMAQSGEIPQGYPPMPEAVSSFGATVLDQHVYIFGGHMGRVPGNSKDGLSPHFSRLNLVNPSAGWEELPILETSQSPGLVAWNGKIYRVGGLSFHNSHGEPTAYHSLSIFASFDPQAGKWTELAPLPVPRSSLDAAVVDGKLYVVGGWNLQGESAQDAVWHEDALVFDLSEENGSWKTIAKPPFQTRALAAAMYDHKLYAMGGISGSRPTSDVHIYDPSTDQWSAGPELSVGGSSQGFALSAFGANGQLYLCAGSGVVYRLNAAADGWESVERLFFPRMFHRLVVGPSGEIVVLGGVGSGTYLANVEAIAVPAPDSSPHNRKSLAWDVKFPGKARHSQALAIHNSTLYVFGGNTSTGPHDFKPENFSNEAFAFELNSQKVEVLKPLPRAMQSGGAFVAGPRIDQSIYVVGGLAPREESFGSTDVIQQYRLRSEAWTEELRHLPASRALFNLVTHNNAAWIFGGNADQERVAETWCWNPVKGSDVEVIGAAELPSPRRSFAGAVLGNRYYAIGGLGQQTSVIDQAHAFDFDTQTWTEIAAPRHSRIFSQLAASGGKLYLSGGFSRVDGHFSSTTAIEVYDPQTNTWEITLEEFAPQLSKMTLLNYQDRLLYYSIDADQAGLAHFVLIDPASQTDNYGPPAHRGEEQTAGQELASQLKAMDRNEDGQLSLDEVGERFQRLVKRIDTNGDGIASPEEIETFTKTLDEENQSSRRGAEGRSERSRSERRGSGSQSRRSN